MAICGLVLTLAQGADSCDRTLGLLRAEPSLTLGRYNGPRLPAVLEIHDERRGEDELRRLSDLPGVEGLELVCVHYEDGEHPSDSAQMECRS